MKLHSLFFIVILSLFILVIGATIVISYIDSTKVQTISDVTIKDLIVQQKIEEKATTHRYIVITDKGTFIVANSTWNLKFNNSDIFYNLEKGQKYDLLCAGIGKGIFTDYLNILEITKK